MRKHLLAAVGCIFSTVASAQELRAAADKWRSCADAAAARYSKSTESAPVVARLAALACGAEKKKVWELLSQSDGANVGDDYVEAMERRYIDRLSVNEKCDYTEQKGAEGCVVRLKWIIRVDPHYGTGSHPHLAPRL